MFFGVLMVSCPTKFCSTFSAYHGVCWQRLGENVFQQHATQLELHDLPQGQQEFSMGDFGGSDWERRRQCQHRQCQPDRVRATTSNAPTAMNKSVLIIMWINRTRKQPDPELKEIFFRKHDA